MKNFRHLLYITAGAAYFYMLYFYFGVENIVAYSERVFITQTSLSYISALVAFFTLFGLISFLEKIIQRIAKRLAAQTETDLDDMVLDILFSSIHTVKYLLAFYIAWQLVDAPESMNAWIGEFSSILLLVIMLLFVTKLINLLFNQKLIDESKMKAMSRSLMPFVRKAIIAVVWVVGIITIISNLGYDVTALIAGA
jgi:MscS family membrane protein